MAITPGAGYQVDPSNPNAVIPIGQTPSSQQNNLPGVQYQTGTTNPGGGGTAPAPTTPSAPQTNLPGIQYVTGTTTPGGGGTGTTPPTTTTTQDSSSATGTSPATGTNAVTPPVQGQPAATMPANGSVVDLLNGLGVNSSFANRTQLAQQFGIQGYSGTSQQNTDLAKKYLDYFNSVKGTNAPQSGADASSAIETGLQDQQGSPQSNPQQDFLNQYLSMNPIEKQMYDTITQSLSSLGTQQTFEQQYQDLTTQAGIPALQTSLMNIQNVMNGTEDDIRTEITKAGGFATESQVQALTGARNKTLLTQANVLSNQLNTQEDYVNQMMQFSEADRADVEKQLDEKIGLTQQLSDMQDKITSAAKSNYQQIADTTGYTGLASLFKGNPQGLATTESILGLPQGALSNQDWLAKADAALNQKGQFDLSAGQSRFDSNGKLIASVPTTAAQNSTTGGSGGTTGSLGSLSDGATNFYAQMASTGVSPNTLLPSLGMGQSAVANKTAILNQIAQNAQTLGIDGGTFGAMLTDSKAKNAAYTQLQKVGSQTEVNADNANKDFGQLVSLSQKMNSTTFSTASPILNSWIRTGQVSVTGNADVNNFVGVLTTALTEYAKVVSGQTGGSAVTVEANKQAQALLSKGLSTAAIQSFADTAKQEMGNRTTSYDTALKSLFSSLTSITDTSGGLGGSSSSGQTVQSNGQSYIVGQVYSDGTSNWTVDAQGNWKKQ